MSMNPNQSGRPLDGDSLSKYLPTRPGEATDSISAAGGVLHVFFEGAKSPQDMILKTPLHICMNKECCQPSVVRHPAIYRINGDMDEVSVYLRCVNCDTRYSRVCSPGEVFELDERIAEAQRGLEQTIERVARENMALDVENLISALDKELVGPDDFATPRTSWVDMQPPIN